MSTRNLSILGLLVAAGLFLAVNVLGASALRSARLDLTENNLFTLTKGSKNIARSVEEPIRLRLYFTAAAANADARIKAYGTRVREVLEEYSRLSGGRIEVTVINPEAFSEAEDEAVGAGLAGLPTPSGERLFFGLVGTNSTDDQKMIPFFDPGKEQFLEYDLTKLIYTLMNPKKPVVGLMSSLPMEGTRPEDFDPRMQQQRLPPWQIVTQMKEVFEVKTVNPTDGKLPEGLDVLMVVHPKALSDETLYAIDQYVLKGGRLLVFVDPNCEHEAINPNANLQAAISQDKSSNLTKLFDAWGISVPRDKVAADKTAALDIPTSQMQNRPETAPMVVYLRVKKELAMLNKDDAVAGQFNELIFVVSGFIDRKTGEGGAAANTDLVLTPIMQTTTDSMRLDQSRVQFIPQPKELLADFAPGGERLTLAARVGGRLKSAFAGPPAPAEGTTPPDAGAHVAQAEQPVNVLVCADVDMLTDRCWVSEQRLGQILLGYTKFSDNGDFVLSAIDQLTGSQDLISVRARGQYARPFTRVQKIQKDAEQKHLAKQQDLDREIREAERRIAELQRQNPNQGAQGGQIILTPEQAEEIRKLQGELSRIRKDKRQVELQMRKDIERLGFTVNVVNTAAIPVAVCGVALGLAGYRASRRRADRARTSRGPA